eukprot:4530927-Prymnesium_polylepis.1
MAPARPGAHAGPMRRATRVSSALSTGVFAVSSMTGGSAPVGHSQNFQRPHTSLTWCEPHLGTSVTAPMR